MVRDRDGHASAASQSKKPAAPYVDLADQPQHQPPPPPPPPQQQQQQHHHHRVKAQKHVVGGATGARLHARIPSSKALAKYAAAAKLNRKHGSVSPERGTLHRRATSDLKLTRDASATNLKKDQSHAALKRNRSHVEVPKKSKSAALLQRSVSNPAVSKLKSTKVQFNLGSDDDDNDDDNDDNEWVDASTSASPLLSRRSSTVAQNAAGQADGASQGGGGMPGGHNSAANGTDLTRDKSSHSLYLTSRILSRTPSHGAPPMMTVETASARPPSIRNQSPPGSSVAQSQLSGDTPGNSMMQARPGSSGKAELTSRFVGHNSQDAGSGTAGESFMAAASRAAAGVADGPSGPKRRPSEGALSQGRGIDALNARQAAAASAADGASDDEDVPPRERRGKRSGEHMNRTQQKLNLQRASSSLEPTHPPGLVGAGLHGPGGVGVGPLLPGLPNSYDPRDPRIARTLERTGMEYLTVRRHLNPVARSVARVMQLPGLENSRRIPQPAGGSGVGSTNPRHPARLSSEHNFVSSAGGPNLSHNPSVADLINGSGKPSHRRPTTPRSVGGAFSSNLQSAASSFSTDDSSSNRMAGDHHHRRRSQSQAPSEYDGQGHGAANRLSGSSLLDGAEDAGTVALLRMMWDKSTLELSASH
ncbi:hypothetical protein VTJ83DRAFT_5435 [Remersonia thermophila]|uniref:Uncharacterized protein n=1 Tax=Remersonia thermophila TaxID=72144 RepID=A0ABR4D6Y0_9PEZI